MGKNILCFFKGNVLTRFGILQGIITYYIIQFIDKEFQKVMDNLKVTHYFTSMNHPQISHKEESTYIVLPMGLQRRIDDVKGNRAEKLPY